MNLGKLDSLPAVKGIGDDAALKMGPAKQPPDLPTTTGFLAVRYDEELARWIRLLGGGPDAVRLAKQARNKQRTEPFATFPELLALVWLDMKGIPYEFQAYVLGGRNRAGGVVPDVLIPYGGGYMVWSIVGLYWHLERFQNDAADRYVVTASTIHGLPVTAFIVIVETDLYDKWDEVCTAAYNNIEWHYMS